MCSYAQCRVGVIKWNECCEIMYKFDVYGGINGGSDDFKDTQTGSKCCCTNRGGIGRPTNGCWLA